MTRTTNRSKNLKLSDVRAADLMRKAVVTLREDESLTSVVATFEEHKIGGAPVVDMGGRLIGFLSGSDIVRTEHVEGGRLATEGRSSDFDALDVIDDDDEGFLREDYRPEELGESLVRDWMQTEVVSLGPDASLQEVCRLLAERSIHRVPIVKDDEVVGIVSTSDIVRFLAGA